MLPPGMFKCSAYARMRYEKSRAMRLAKRIPVKDVKVNGTRPFNISRRRTKRQKSLVGLAQNANRYFLIERLKYHWMLKIYPIYEN